MNYIRDLKGIKTIDGRTIKEGVLFRSSQLYKPSKKQLSYLKSIKLKRIIDLRNEQEAIDEKNVDLGDLDYHNISLIDSNLNGITHVENSKKLLILKSMPTMCETYEDIIINDYSISQVKKAIRLIVLEDKFPTLIHCVTGKDRAGIITYITLKILGVSDQDAMDDYLKQRKYYIGTARKYCLLAFILSLNISLAIKAYGYFDVRSEFMEAVLKQIDIKFNSFDEFVSNYLELSKQDIEKFKDRILK